MGEFGRDFRPFFKVLEGSSAGKSLAILRKKVVSSSQESSLKVY